MAKNNSFNNSFAFNFSKVDTPAFVEKRNKNIVYWGDDNLYPNYLIQLANQSGLHGSLVTSIAQDIAGGGFNWQIDGGEPDKKIIKILTAFEKNANSTETLQSIVSKCATDLKVLNCFALNIIWDKAKKSIAEIYHMDASALRACPVDSKGRVTEYKFCNDWNYAGKDGYEEVILPAFDPNNKKQASQILFIKPYWLGQLYYPRVEYAGSIQAIETDYRIHNYWMNLVTNSMTPSMFINFNDGIPDSEEEKDIVYARIKSMYGGGENAGKFILNFSESKETAAEITPIQPANLADQYKAISEEVQQSILFGHKITSPMLVGIKTEGQLGGGGEILQANELYFSKVIRPKQNLIEQTLEKILYINTGKEIECEIQNNEPVKLSIDASLLAKYFDEEEIRSLYGYEARTKTINPGNIPSDSTPSDANSTSNTDSDENPGENTTAPTV